MSDIQTVLAIVATALAIAGVIWKVAVPMAGAIFGRQVLYAARVAELMVPEDLISFALDEFLPIPRFPSYSELSSEGATFPSRYFDDRSKGFALMRSTLVDLARKQAQVWESTVPEQMSFPAMGGTPNPDMLDYQTWARLRWFWHDKCGSQISKVASVIGKECAEAVETLEAYHRELLECYPTRCLIIRIKNRTSIDAKDLKVDITSGGEIYDVVVNDDLRDGEVTRSNNRFMIKWPVVQPDYVVEIKLWYVWQAVLFGNRTASQSTTFPGFEVSLLTI